MNAHRPLLALALLSGCTVTEDSWGRKEAEVQCDFLKRCDQLYFFQNYDDAGECLDKKLDYWDTYGSQVVQGCQFDQEAAQECLDLYSQSCETIADDLDDIQEACAQAWDCANLYGGG